MSILWNSASCPSWPPAWPEIRAAVEAVLADGQWGRYHSDIHATLTARLGDAFHVPNVRLTSSGTAAIELALRAARLQPGDEVIVSAFDFPGNRRTLELLNLKPVLVDCLAGRCVIDTEQVRNAAGPQTRAALVSHLYGDFVDVADLRNWGDDTGRLVIEDACHAAGVNLQGRVAGGWGDFGIVSFGGSKTLTSGNGGALLCQNARLAQRCAVLAERPSDAFPLSTLQAAALLPQIERLPEMAARRAAAVTVLENVVDRNASNGWAKSSHRDDVATTNKDSWDTYKWAFWAPSHAVRQRLIAAAASVDFPLREVYRASGKAASRRCRTPSATPHAERAGQCLVAIDHPLLLADESDLGGIAECLEQLLAVSINP